MAAATATAPAPELLVRDAVETYVAAREKRSAVRGRDARWRLAKHVLADARLAGLPVSRLSEADVAAWRRRLPADMRPATINRLLNDVRAALTLASPGGVLPAALAAKLKGEADATVAREVVPLTVPDTRRLIEAAKAAQPRSAQAWKEDAVQAGSHFGRLVLVLAATGARLSQVARITVGDVQVAAGRIMVPASAKGRATRSRKPIPVPVGEDVLAELKPVLAGRLGGDLLLTKPDGSPWKSPSELARPWKAAITAAGLKHAVPYDLRHSSIIRMLGAGTPIRFVAMTHDTSVAMIEAHYSRFITSEVEAAARAAIVPLAGSAAPQLRVVRA